MAFLLIFFGMIFIDQAFKFFIIHTTELGQIKELLTGVISLTREHNYGVAFSFLSGKVGANILAFVSLGIVLLLIILMLTKVIGTRGQRIAMTFVIAGAVSNAVDRLIRGYVVDMFKFEFIRFGIFNVADICIVIGVIIFAVLWIAQDNTKAQKKKKKRKKSKNSSDDDYDQDYSYEEDTELSNTSNINMKSDSEILSEKGAHDKEMPEDGNYSLDDILKEFYSDGENK